MTSLAISAIVLFKRPFNESSEENTRNGYQQMNSNSIWATFVRAVCNYDICRNTAVGISPKRDDMLFFWLAKDKNIIKKKK